MALQGGYNVTAIAVPSSAMPNLGPSSVRLTPGTGQMAGAEEHKWPSEVVTSFVKHIETTSSLELFNWRAGHRRRRRRQAAEGPWLELSEWPAPGGLTTLDCKAGGFSTRNITLVWLKDGEPRPQETRQGAVLLNGNGTYHTGATIDIDPSDRHNYTCRVERPSLPGGLQKDWEPKSNAQPSVGVSVWLIVGVGLLVSGTFL